MLYTIKTLNDLLLQVITALIDPEPVTLYTQLPIILWIMETAPHKLGMTTDTPVRQDVTTPGNWLILPVGLDGFSPYPYQMPGYWRR